MMNGIIHIENFIENPGWLFEWLIRSVNWDESMTARKTASFGKAYNYSQMHYPFVEFPEEISKIIEKIEPVVGFKANNCLLNYYLDGKSKMGYHSDQVDILARSTGVAIISVGETRILKFRSIHNPGEFVSYKLEPGSLIFMTQEVQDEWQHCIPPSNTESGRISMTFRELT